MSIEETYEQDRKYLHATLDKNVANVEKLFDKFETFKVEVTSSIAVIQAKLLIYASLAGFGSSALVTFLLR